MHTTPSNNVSKQIKDYTLSCRRTGNGTSLHLQKFCNHCYNQKLPPGYPEPCPEVDSNIYCCNGASSLVTLPITMLATILWVPSDTLLIFVAAMASVFSPPEAGPSS